MSLKVDLMMNCWVRKDFSSLWKTWKRKVSTRRPNVSVIAGVSDDNDIVNQFATHFYKCQNENSDEPSSLQSFHSLRISWTRLTLLVTGFYPRDAMLARVIVIATCPSVRPSVCPSVRPAVTRRYCVKTKKASGMISSPSGSHKTLVFRRQISSPKASNKDRSEKFSDFLASSVNISKTVADTAKVTISD